MGKEPNPGPQPRREKRVPTRPRALSRREGGRGGSPCPAPDFNRGDRKQGRGLCRPRALGRGRGTTKGDRPGPSAAGGQGGTQPRALSPGLTGKPSPAPQARGHSGPAPVRTAVEEAGEEAQHQADHGGAALKGAAPRPRPALSASSGRPRTRLRRNDRAGAEERRGRERGRCRRSHGNGRGWRFPWRERAARSRAETSAFGCRYLSELLGAAAQRGCSFCCSAGTGG